MHQLIWFFICAAFASIGLLNYVLRLLRKKSLALNLVGHGLFMATFAPITLMSLLYGILFLDSHVFRPLTRGRGEIAEWILASSGFVVMILVLIGWWGLLLFVVPAKSKKDG